MQYIKTNTIKNQIKKIGVLIILLSYVLVGFTQTEFLVTINPTTGIFTKIDSLPGIKLITTLPNYTTFDENNQRFIFRGGDNYGIWYLYSVDVNTGNIISKPVFPVLSDPYDNVIELQYDNSAGILYALHWDANAISVISNNKLENNHIISVYPFSTNTKIKFNKVYNESSFLFIIH